MTYSTETVRNVFDDDEGVPLSIGPDPDGMSCVRLYTATDAAKAYWGDIEVTMQPELARQVGLALIAAAKEAQAPESKTP